MAGTGGASLDQELGQINDKIQEKLLSDSHSETGVGYKEGASAQQGKQTNIYALLKTNYSLGDSFVKTAGSLCG